MGEDEELLADPALLARLRRIDEALAVLNAQSAVQHQRLMQIEQAIGALKTAADRRDALLAEWIDPAIDLTGLMAQLAEIGRKNMQVVAELAAQLAREHATTRSAISLAVAAVELEATAGELVQVKRPANRR